MKEKLLNAYWKILVTLLLGDTIIGIIWLFQYSTIVTNLQSDLKTRLSTEYGIDPSFHVSRLFVACLQLFSTIELSVQ